MSFFYFWLIKLKDKNSRLSTLHSNNLIEAMYKSLYFELVVSIFNLIIYHFSLFALAETHTNVPPSIKL